MNTPHPAPEAKHTHSPYVTAGCAIYQADNWQDGNNLGGAFVATSEPGDPDEMPDEVHFANAAHIVLCVNTHARLREALQELCDDAAHHLEHIGYPHDKAMLTLALIDQARAALKESEAK